MNAKALLLSLLVVSLVFAEYAELNQTCKFSGECREGYCDNGKCKLPSVIERYQVVGKCKVTADCVRGFCWNEECILPLREEYTILTFGVKSGCAGMIENCTGIWCAFCNLTWVFLIVGAFVAAFMGRKRGRVLPVLLAVIPLGVGLLVLPLFGFVLTLVEMFVLIVVKKKKRPLRRIR